MSYSAFGNEAVHMSKATCESGGGTWSASSARGDPGLCMFPEAKLPPLGGGAPTNQAACATAGGEWTQGPDPFVQYCKMPVNAPPTSGANADMMRKVALGALGLAAVGTVLYLVTRKR